MKLNLSKKQHTKRRWIRSPLQIQSLVTVNNQTTSYPNTQLNTQPNICTSDEPMETDFCGQTDQIRTPKNLNVFVRLKQRNTWTRENIRFRPNMFHQHLPQIYLRPLCKSKSLLSPKGLLLIKTYDEQIQILFL